MPHVPSRGMTCSHGAVQTALFCDQVGTRGVRAPLLLPVTPAWPSLRYGTGLPRCGRSKEPLEGRPLPVLSLRGS